MTYDEFVGQVQSRARLGSTGEAVRATRATLEVLGQRLFGGEAKDLAAQLPQEIGYYLRQDGQSERFGLDEFFARVSEREGVDLPVAVHHARAVISVVSDAASQGEIDDVRNQLPAEYDALFESGSEGTMNRTQ
jgi:uncharacterized protein (DUF2267 family)